MGEDFSESSGWTESRFSKRVQQSINGRCAIPTINSQRNDETKPSHAKFERGSQTDLQIIESKLSKKISENIIKAKCQY